MDHKNKEILLKDGRTCVIRRPVEEDAGALVAYMKAIAAETRNLMRQPEEVLMTVEQEREFLSQQKDNDRELMLLAEVDGKHAGLVSASGVYGWKRTRHRCSVAVALYREFWGLGIGTALMGEILSAAKAAGYERAELEVVSANEPAVALYRKFGFETAGTITEAVKYEDGSYADFLLMTKRL